VFIDDYKLDMLRRQAASDAIDSVIADLTGHAQDPEKIGRRVLVLQFVLAKEKGFPKLKDLAERLGVSPARASAWVSEYVEVLEDARTVNRTPSGRDQIVNFPAREDAAG
jgi:hypothetical protein